MYVYPILLGTADLTGIAIALKRLVPLLIPVRAIVAICAALPTVVVRATMVSPKALAATVEVGAVCPGDARKHNAAVPACEGRLLTNAEPSSGSDALTLADLGAKSLLLVSGPIGCVWGNERLATELTGRLNSLTDSPLRFVLALTRAVSPRASGVLELNSADGANMNRQCHTSDSMLRETALGHASRIRRSSAADQATLAHLSLYKTIGVLSRRAYAS